MEKREVIFDAAEDRQMLQITSKRVDVVCCDKSSLWSYVADVKTCSSDCGSDVYCLELSYVSPKND